MGWMCVHGCVYERRAERVFFSADFDKMGICFSVRFHRPLTRIHRTSEERYGFVLA